MPPMFPTCMSVTRTSGGSAETAARTSSPVRISRISVSSSSRADLSSERTESESLTTKMRSTSGRLVSAEQMAGDDLEPLEIVHVLFEERDPHHGRGRDFERELADVSLLVARHRHKV